MPQVAAQPVSNHAGEGVCVDPFRTIAVRHRRQTSSGSGAEIVPAVGFVQKSQPGVTRQAGRARARVFSQRGSTQEPGNIRGETLIIPVAGMTGTNGVQVCRYPSIQPVA